MNVHPDDSPSELALEAAEWVEKLSGEDGELFAPAAEQWCSRSAEHRREFMLASLTSIQLEALRTRPYSFGLSGYRTPLHRWIEDHFDDVAQLREVGHEVHARLLKEAASAPSSKATRTLYALSLELATWHERQAHNDPSVDTEAKPSAQQRIADAFDAAMKELPRECRDALLLCSRDRLTHEEAAEALGLTAEAVRQYLTRARQTIAAKLVNR